MTATLTDYPTVTQSDVIDDICAAPLTVLWTSPSASSGIAALRRFRAELDDIRVPYRSHVANQQLHLFTGSKVFFGSRGGRYLGRDIEADLVVLDEAWPHEGLPAYLASNLIPSFHRGARIVRTERLVTR